jgi:tetratricopeptide (TPR) repeat protein/tRNA A-37 threonylcarbamoyl transferase component Bud32
MPQHDAVRLQALFAAAVELPQAEREATLARECAGHPELLAELHALLEADARVLGTTAQPVTPGIADWIASSAPGPSLSGMRVGAFELREELGRGGMGTVYRAERVDGCVDQVVAIKFMRRELLDANTLRRFQLERQLMATLDHPNITRLLDASELADGTPYFVMEYVDGVPITDYCERENLSVRERVALLRRVCGAVAEAHRELIVHRDLKPANILISAGGVPKLLDFGIAKPLQTPAGATVNAETRTAQRYFSPLYAAPEQLSGAPVGVACDVYALGLVMYEMLTGSRPFDFSQMSAAQIERLVLDVPPPAPSVALARRMGPGGAIRPRQLQCDLDGIVLRCLRKATHERYASVEQLEADLCNYLDGRPVLARGGHGWYRMQKFVRRNVLEIAAGALVAMALLMGIVAFAWQTRIAQQRAAELEQVSRFQAEMLGQIDPSEVGRHLGKDLEDKFERALVEAGVPEAERGVRVANFGREWGQLNPTDVARDLIDHTILKPAVEAIDTRFKDQPLVAASLRQALALRYMEMGLYDAARPLQEQALAARRRVLGEEHPETLSSMSYMGVLLVHQGNPIEAELYYSEALRKRRHVMGDEHPNTIDSISNLGQMLMAQGKSNQAEPYFRELERRQGVPDEAPLGALPAAEHMVSLLHYQGKPRDAELYLRKTLQMRRRAFGEEHPETIYSIDLLARVLRTQGKLDAAEPLFREALDKSRRALGAEHPYTLSVLGEMGVVLLHRGKLAESERYLRDSLLEHREILGPDHPNTLLALNRMGMVLRIQGKLSKAEAYAREAVARSRRVLGNEHPQTLTSVRDLGLLLYDQGKLGEAELHLQEALAIRRQIFGDNFLATLISISDLGALRVAQGRYREAEALLAPAEPAARKALTGDNAYYLAKFLVNLGNSRTGLHQFAAAEASLLEAFTTFARVPQPDPRDEPACTQSIIDLYTAWHIAEPDKGFDVRSAEWSSRVADGVQER